MNGKKDICKTCGHKLIKFISKNGVEYWKHIRKTEFGHDPFPTFEHRKHMREFHKNKR
jgi:hypothetical protein